MKRKFLSLLLSAVMLLSLVTPAFAADEEPNDEAALENAALALEDAALAEEDAAPVEEETAAEEGGEVTLFGLDNGGAAASGGGGGGGNDYDGEYCYDEKGVATFMLYEGFRAAMADENVTAVLIEEDHYVTFSGFDETIEVTKPLIIDGGLFIENTYVSATADVTVNGRLTIRGDFDRYTEWKMDAPDSYWVAFTEMPEQLDGPKLINNGIIEMEDMSGIMLSWPCDYEEAREGVVLAGGEFKYADYLNYFSEDGNDGLTACYTPEQAKIASKFYDEDGNEAGEAVLRTAFVNTEKGLLAALNSNVYNSSIQAFSKGKDDELTLSAKGTYTAPCTLMTNVPFTVGAGVTLNLAEGTFNQFNNGLSVAGTLNVNTNGNMTFINGGMTVKRGGKLVNKPGSNLNLNIGYADIAGTLENMGSLGFYGEWDEGCIDVNGLLSNSGRLDNCVALIVKDGGEVKVEDSNKPITYDFEEGWETLGDHVLFNRAFLKAEEGGTLTVGGALQNDGGIEICGEMNILASTAGDNMQDGVVNGSVKSFGNFELNGGTLTVEGADATGEHDAVFVNVGELWMHGEGAELALDGIGYQYGYIGIDEGEVSIRGELYNDGGDIELNGGLMKVFGYLRNNSRLRLNGGMLEILPASEPNCGDDPKKFNEKCSVLCNNGEMNIEEGAQLMVDAAEVQGYYNALMRNNGDLRINGGERGGARLALGGTLVNDGRVENWGSFTVTAKACIDNHAQLRVDDSESYRDWGYAPIEWADGASAEKNLNDAEQLRLAQVRWDRDNAWYELRVDIYSIKFDEWHDMTVVGGQDYFGGWDEVKGASVETENLRYNEYGDRDDQGELDETVHIHVLREDNGLFALRFEEWGETRVVLRQGNKEQRYNGGTSLNHAGFYYDCDIIGDWGELDEQRAQDAAVLGNCYCYNPGDELFLMKRDCGFDGEHINEAEIRINGEMPDRIKEEDGCFRVFKYGECLLELELIDLGREGCDILVRFCDGATGDFDFNFRYRDADCYLRCLKPVVYIENVVGFKGEEATIAVRAENIPMLLGYQFQLRFDADKLQVEDVSFRGEYESEPVVVTDNKNGTVRVVVASTENREIENGELFYVTFTVADSDAVGACDDIWVDFDDGFEQRMGAQAGDYEKHMIANFFGGCIQTFIPGDVHRDGEVDVLDAVRLLRAAAQLVELDAGEREAARLTEDGSPINGVVPILRHIARGDELRYCPAQA